MPNPISYLRLSITDKCDMHCVYCIPRPETLARARSVLTCDEIAGLVAAFARNGVTKVRITGGEPLLRPDVVQIVRVISTIPGISTVGVTTNGVRLRELACDLASAGLRTVNISLDSLNPATFRRITGRDALADVLRGIEAALDRGFEKVKINTVVMRGVNDSELLAIAELARDLAVEVRFIELMRLGHSLARWREFYVPAAEIRTILGLRDPQPRLGSSSARFYSLPHGRGAVGIISPVSDHFCDACDRVRVTSTGKLKPCLRLPYEEDIRPLLSEPDLDEKLGAALRRMAGCKLPSDTVWTSSIEAGAMCSVGG